MSAQHITTQSFLTMNTTTPPCKQGKHNSIWRQHKSVFNGPKPKHIQVMNHKWLHFHPQGFKSCLSFNHWMVGEWRHTHTHIHTVMEARYQVCEALVQTFGAIWDSVSGTEPPTLEWVFDNRIKVLDRNWDSEQKDESSHLRRRNKRLFSQAIKIYASYPKKSTNVNTICHNVKESE